MTLAQFLSDPAWDAPFFKILAHNDTGNAAGHQGGMVLPKDLRKYLPALDEGATSSAAPTTDRRIEARMHLGSLPVASGSLRYQLQTWGGTRGAESRITDGLRPLRDLAAVGDMLIFQRQANSLDHFRLTLVPKASDDFKTLTGHLPKNARWGVLDRSTEPLTTGALREARRELVDQATRPFDLLPQAAQRTESKQRRIARSVAFRLQVRRAYGFKCAASGYGISTPDDSHEVEAAHVVPLGEGGPDDIRNGIALTRTLHWAFDQGLWGIEPGTRKVTVPKPIRAKPDNAFLSGFDGRVIADADDPAFRIHPDALDWHLANRVARWR